MGILVPGLLSELGMLMYEVRLKGVDEPFTQKI